MSAHSPVEFAERGRETARVEAFSDGVFAIAVTLLVLNLKVPSEADAGGNHGGLAETLFNQWPVYAAYIFSFITVLLMWIAHHNFFNYLTGMDTAVMLTNGFQLMGITIVPFTTALLSQWATNPQESGLVAAIYSGTFAFITWVVFLQFIYVASRKGLLRTDLRPGLVNGIRLRNLIGPSFYTLASLLGIFVSAWACLVLCGILLLYYAAVILYLARRWFEG
jgi:TMEM175 potassium channel family protein